MNPRLSIECFARSSRFVKSGGHVEVAFGIDAHAIATATGIEIDKNSFVDSVLLSGEVTMPFARSSP